MPTPLGRLITLVSLMILPWTALAQNAWVQIEARPTLEEILDRAATYAARLDDVGGYRLSSGWYAVALGPYDEGEAGRVLRRLRAARLIPSDSFVADGRNLRDRIYPGPGADPETRVTAAAEPEAEPEAPADAAEPPRSSEETPEQARASERLLTREERERLQIALQFYGVYDAAIDGDFGAGTRRAMAEWQQAEGFEVTGVLTSPQRRKVIEDFETAVAELAPRLVRDDEAGIEIVMPEALTPFQGHTPPFARYGDEGGPRVLLISQTGDADTLKALYDIMQTLEIVPLEGPRELRRSDFTLTGENDRILSHTYATLAGDAIKGFTLVWPADDRRRRDWILKQMQASFTPLPGAVLPNVVATDVQDADLLAGLEIRRPERSRSGFFVSADGHVLTTSDAVDGCGRVTIGIDDLPVEVAKRSDELGLALLRPEDPLAPIRVARIATALPRLRSELAVAGFSFGGVLGAPSLTYGTLADGKGLDGDVRLARLELDPTEADAGGPVLTEDGRVAGVLLSRPGDGARQLPEGVVFAAKGDTVTGFLADAGVPVSSSEDAERLDPDALLEHAGDMTVLVSCWR